MDSRPRMLLAALAAASAMQASGCSEAQPTAEGPGAVLPESIEIETPDTPITQLSAVEDATEEVADRLLSFSDKLRRRDFEAAAEWFTEDFVGEGLGGLELLKGSEGHLGVVVEEFDIETSPVLRRPAFLSSLEDCLENWSHLESAIWKVKGAEFQRGRGQRWGKVKLFIHLIGTQENGGGVALEAWGYARAVSENGVWKLSQFDLDSLEITHRDAPIFTAVAAAAGVAHTWPRFGTEENNSFAFNGAACADVDEDGRWDLFVPSDGRNFLYLGTRSGSFVEAALARGLSSPPGGTGAVFFDFDNDGDQDLAVGHVEDGVGGDRIELYVNDGKGTFERAPGGLGLGSDPVVAYSLTAFDHDADGWLDLYVCGYGIVNEDHNNSWIEATNGSPNALFRNLGGKGFEDVAAEAGVRGQSWSYASAAADFDGDGDLDLYVANDYGTNRLYSNMGDGTFEDVAAKFGVTDQGNGMGVTLGDLSGDGVLDLYVSNMSSTAGNRILNRYTEDVPDEIWAALKKAAAGNTVFVRGDGDTFASLPKSAGGVGANWAWSAALADFDLDGRLDIFCANGFVTGNLPFDT